MSGAAGQCDVSLRGFTVSYADKPVASHQLGEHGMTRLLSDLPAQEWELFARKYSVQLTDIAFCQIRLDDSLRFGPHSVEFCVRGTTPAQKNRKHASKTIDISTPQEKTVHTINKLLVGPTGLISEHDMPHSHAFGHAERERLVLRIGDYNIAPLGDCQAYRRVTEDRRSPAALQVSAFPSIAARLEADLWMRSRSIPS